MASVWWHVCPPMVVLPMILRQEITWVVATTRKWMEELRAITSTKVLIEEPTSQMFITRGNPV